MGLRAFAVLFTLLITAVAVVAGVAVSEPHGGSPVPSVEGDSTARHAAAPGRDPAGPRIDVEAAPSATSGAVTYRITVTELDRASRFHLAVGERATVTRAVGFEREPGGARTRYVATPAQRRGELVVEVPADATGPETAYPSGEAWSMTRVPFVLARWSPVGSDDTRTVRPLGDGYDGLADDSTATYGDRYALVGDQTATVHEVAGQRVRLVRPTGTDIGAGETQVAASLRAASRQLRVGDRDETLTLFALPAPTRRGGEAFPSRDEAWIRADSAVDSPNNVWVHEYVHTRQEFQLSREMAWFREASAEYYAARLTQRQGRVGRGAVVTHLDGAPKSVPLTDPSAWRDGRVPYTKGARVLALVDRNIRESTDGERSLQDVFRRMNEHEGRVTYAEFKRMVAATAGHSMDRWLDRYVAGSHPVAGMYEPEPTRSGVLGVAHAVLAGDRAVQTTLALAVVLGAALSMPVYAGLVRLRRRRLLGRLRRRVVG